MQSVSCSPNAVTAYLATVEEAVKAALPAIDQVTTAITSGHFVYSWMTVMLVTFAEAYLEDALKLLMSQALSSSALHDDVKVEIGNKWVKEALRSGRPHDWIKRLEKLGVSGYAPNQADKLLVVWQRRHTLVHTAEPEIPNTAAYEFLAAVTLITDFIKATDAQLLTICPGAS